MTEKRATVNKIHSTQAARVKEAGQSQSRIRLPSEPKRLTKALESVELAAVSTLEGTTIEASPKSGSDRSSTSRPEDPLGRESRASVD